MSGIRIPLTNPTGGGSLGGGISPNSGTQGLQASAQLFGTIGNAAQQGFDTQVKLERIEQKRNLNNLKSGIKNMTAEYQNELLKNKDSTTWQPNYEEKLSAFLGNQNFENLSPEAREEWDMWHTDYADGQKLRIARDATIQGLKNAELDLNNNMRVAEGRGDFEESARLRQESGLFTSEELGKGDLDAQKRQDSWESQELRKWHNQQLMNDPVGYLDTLTAKKDGEHIGYENLDPEERRSMISQAKREVQSRRGQESDSLKERIATGEITSPNQLQEMVDSGKINYLNAADIAAYKKHLTRDTPTSDTELVRSMEVINTLKELKGKVSDFEYVKAFNKAQNEILPVTQKSGNGWIKQRLYYHSPNYKEGKYGKENTLLKKGKVDAMELTTMHVTNMYNNDAFGNKYMLDNRGEPLLNSGGQKKLNLQAMEDSASVMQKMEEWVSSQDKPVTIDEARTQLGTIIEKKESDTNLKNGIPGGSKMKQGLENSIKTKPYIPYQKAFKAGGLDSIGASRKRADIPYNGVKAAIRYNNPSAAYPRKSDEKYGIQGYGVLKSGQGTHKIGKFPTPVHGAAANFHTFAAGYKGMTVYDAVNKWRGNGERGEKVVVPKGYSSNSIITDEFINDPEKATDFFSKMAAHESAGEGSLSSSEWRKAWNMWKANS